MELPQDAGRSVHRVARVLEIDHFLDLLLQPREVIALDQTGAILHPQMAVDGEVDRQTPVFRHADDVRQVLVVPIRDAEDYQKEHRWELPKLADAFAKLTKYPIEVIDGIGTIREIEAEIDKHSDYDVVCCDYIQIVSSDNNDNRENAISEVARRLKLSAMKHKMVMFTASQLNDEGKLRESRAIGMHSDQVVCIEHKGKSKLIVRKNRRGARNAMISVTMNGELSRFDPEF